MTFEEMQALVKLYKKATRLKGKYLEILGDEEDSGVITDVVYFMCNGKFTIYISGVASPRNIKPEKLETLVETGESEVEFDVLTEKCKIIEKEEEQ